MNPCIDALDTSHFSVLLKKLLRSLSEFLSHLYSVAPPYLEFHYFNSPFKQKFNCKYIFQMHLVDLFKTHEQLVLSVSYTLMVKPANQSQKIIPGQGISNIMGQGLTVRNGKFSKAIMLLSTHNMSNIYSFFFNKWFVEAQLQITGTVISSEIQTFSLATYLSTRCTLTLYNAHILGNTELKKTVVEGFLFPQHDNLCLNKCLIQ